MLLMAVSSHISGLFFILQSPIRHHSHAQRHIQITTE